MLPKPWHFEVWQIQTRNQKCQAPMTHLTVGAEKWRWRMGSSIVS
jgi:hypothetical protein